MEKRFDVVALGELLIDFTENGTSAQGNPLMEANLGGAPCNVLAMLEKLGKNCAFIGKVGDDLFGKMLRDEIVRAGICDDALLTDPEARTTLAFVKTFPNGDRDFSFYRNPGADMMLREDELPLAMLQDTRIFHFGTLSMTTWCQPEPHVVCKMFYKASSERDDTQVSARLSSCPNISSLK